MNLKSLLFYKSLYSLNPVSRNNLHKCPNVKSNLKLLNLCPALTNCYSHSTHDHVIATSEDVEKISKNKDKNVVSIDVCELEELVETVLPSNINISWENLENIYEHVLDKDVLKIYDMKKPNKNIFCCNVDQRSATACKVSQQLGFEIVKNYFGGWLEWNDRNRRKLNGYMSYCTRAPGSKKLRTFSFEEVRRYKNDPKYILIDVREPAELVEGFIPNSINIPLAHLEDVFKNVSSKEFLSTYGREKPRKDTNIIFSCRSGKRSEMAQKKAIELGFKNVIRYAGGYSDWEKHTKKKR